MGVERLRGVWLVVLGLFAFQAQAATLEQTTVGWCSPAVGQTHTVTIVCQGVDPKALARLNELLDKKDFELQVKIRQAEAWTQKYRELEQRLAAEGQESPLAQQAQAFVKEGRLEEAGALLDRLLNAEEKAVERVAAHHFNRAEVYALQFQPDKALPHYEKAYRSRPDNPVYAHRYAVMLQGQGDFQTAETLYKQNLTTLRARATSDPNAYLPDIARTLNNLGNLYRATQRLSEGTQAYQEALGTYRQLAETTPALYLPDLARTLNYLAVLTLDKGDPPHARPLVEEALTIRRRLWEKQPAVYGNALAGSLQVSVMILLQMAGEHMRVCQQLQELTTVTTSESLLQWARERTETMCDSGQ